MKTHQNKSQTKNLNAYCILQNYRKEKCILLKYLYYDLLIKEYVPNLSLYNFKETKISLKLTKYKILFVILNIISIFYLMPIIVEDFKEIEEFIKFNLDCNLSNSPSEFYNRKNPEISIVISTFNGEVYLKPAVRSIQNQNFLNLEIIIVDDGSMDNSVEIIKELMKEDRRIKLLSNGINRGTLYTKTRGVLNTKGKYIMVLDHDNLYAKKNVFSELYREAVKYNIDILGFSSIKTEVKIKNLTKNHFLNYFRTKIIKKPYIKKRFLGTNHKIKSGTYLCLYFFGRKLFLNAIKQIGDEFINRNIDAHDDTILMFIISRNAVRLKHLKEIYYIILEWPKEYSESLIFQRTIKFRERKRKNCYSYLTFIEIMIKFTLKSEKFIAENFLFMWFLGKEICRNNTDVMDYAIKVCNLFLDNEYVSSFTKKKIYLYLNETKNRNKNLLFY